ncbi:MAG: hypothetical protein QOE68_1249 [Thermoanaerobaculia bacterium]|nr:hypothetical protein [Thermoanaerobaculia bacterium]
MPRLRSECLRAAETIVGEPIKMKQTDFEELIDSVREAGRILRGEAAPSREFQLTAEDLLGAGTAGPSPEPQKNE